MQLVVQFVITWYMIEHGAVLLTAVVGGVLGKAEFIKTIQYLPQTPTIRELGQLQTDLPSLKPPKLQEQAPDEERRENVGVRGTKS